MPPWQAENEFGGFRNGHALSAREMDMILEWSSGGYPKAQRPVPGGPTGATARAERWTLGDPTVVLRMPEPFLVDANTGEAVRYFVLPSRGDRDRSILGAELNPGVRALVRGAAIFIDTSGRARSLDRADASAGFAETADRGFPVVPPVAVWSPGRPPVLNHEYGYVLPAGADVVLRIHYKKTWLTEGMEFSDQSEVGFYLSDEPVREIGSVVVADPAEISGRTLTLTHELTDDITVLSLLPEVDVESSDLVIEAVKPDGERIPMLWLREPDGGWPTRFWFDAPVSLPSGTVLEARATVDSAAERIPGPTLIGERGVPVRFAFDYLAASAGR